MKISMKYYLSLISALLVGGLVVLACGWGPDDDSETSLFAPEIIQNKSLEPFFYNSLSPFYDNGYYEQHNKVCNNVNVKEWKAYFDNAINDKALSYWLYRAAPEQIDNMILTIKGKPKPLNDSSKIYTLATVAPPEKATAFLFFVGFAKRNETFATNTLNDWDSEAKPSNESNSIEKQIEGGKKLLSNAKSDFLKERYHFQIVRLLFFNKQYDEAINWYNYNEQFFKSGNSMKWRALGYKAAALLYKGKQFEANYLYSVVYDKLDEHKKVAFLSFHLQNENDVQSVLSYAKNVREKQVIWLLYGLKADPVKALSAMIELEPKNELVDLLLVRIINSEERSFIPALYSLEAKDNDSKPSQSAVNLISAIAENRKNSNPDLYCLGAAYLNYGSGNYAKGDLFLANVKNTKGNELLNLQKQIITLYGKLKRAKDINENVEEELLPIIKDVFSEKNNQIQDARFNHAKRWTRVLLANLYLKKGEEEKSELVYPGMIKGKFEKIEAIQKMIAFWDSKSHTALENYFMQNPMLTKDAYVNYLGIRYAWNDEPEKAVEAFKKRSGASYTLLGNPFNIHIKDCHDCDHMAEQKSTYTQLSLMEKIVEMKKKAKTNKAEAAQNYFLIANAYYNITHFGNARVFYQNAISNKSYYLDYEKPKMSPDLDNALALKYYLLARETSKDKEFRAKCTFMAAKCEQNAWYLNKPQGYVGDFKAGIYFRQLKREFSSTDYYRDIINECSYFNTFNGN